MIRAADWIGRAIGAASAEPGRTMAHPELVADALRGALDALGEVTGEVTPDDVLGLVFSRFCIGK
jgi:tRNA modification GTPase